MEPYVHPILNDKANEVVLDKLAQIDSLKEESKALEVSRKAIQARISHLNHSVNTMAESNQELIDALVRTHTLLVAKKNRVCNFIQDVTHYIELNDGSLSDDVKLLKALWFGIRLKRMLQDRTALITGSYYDLTGTALKKAAPLGYKEHLERLNSDRVYNPRSMSLEDVLSENYIREI